MRGFLKSAVELIKQIHRPFVLFLSDTLFIILSRLFASTIYFSTAILISKLYRSFDQKGCDRCVSLILCGW